MNDWETVFKSKLLHISDESCADCYNQSALKMRELIRSKLLLFDDIHVNPEKFFFAHRIMAYNTPKIGFGFWVRMTVQYNLFAGTIMALGTDFHREQLKIIQDHGLLGCFCLTESFAGVHSGLIIQTTAVLEGTSIVFNSSLNGAKNWISQGLVAEKAVIIANLYINNTNYGIQAFLVTLRENGKLCAGISMWNMGNKTVGNDLDNARIIFKDFKVPKTTLLNKYIDITDDNHVVIKNKLVKSFHVIGQQLFSGRVCVAQAALEFRKRLYEDTKQYAQSKMCWTINGAQKLYAVPHITQVFMKNEVNFDLCMRYVQICESRLCKYLRSKQLPNDELMTEIVIAKIKCVEDSIVYVNQLQNEIGSYALMADSGFGQRDFLTCCKFAEGDTRILMQKLARDQLKKYKNKQVSKNESINKLCFNIYMQHNEEQPYLLYELAHLIIDDKVSQVFHFSKI